MKGHLNKNPNKCKILVLVFFTYIDLYENPCTILSPWSSSTSLSPSCQTPVVFLWPSCRKKTPCRSPVALLSLSCRSPVALSCRFPVASLSAASPVALLSSSFSFSVAYPVAMSCFLLLPCRHRVATMSPPCRPPVALLLQLPCRLPVACLLLPVALLPLSCRFPVVFLSPPCRLSVATLLPSCRSLPHFTVASFAWPESIEHRYTFDVHISSFATGLCVNQHVFCSALPLWSNWQQGGLRSCL